jgi:hypothetical protein
MSKNDWQPDSIKRELYTLDQASVKTHCSVPSILKMAADGWITFYTTIPIGWEIYSIETTALPSCQYKNSTSLFISLETNYFGTFEKSDPDIELLILSANDCKNLAYFDHVKQGAFQIGLKTTFNLPPSQKLPTKKTNNNRIRYNDSNWLRTFNRCFAVCKKVTSKEEFIHWNINRFPYHEIMITKDMIRISHAVLNKITEHLANHQGDKSVEVQPTSNEEKPNEVGREHLKKISQRPYTPGTAYTKLLDTLYKASKYAWETKKITGKYPSSPEVEDKILRLCLACSRSLAQKSANMIRPSAYNDETSIISNEVFEPFLTNYFWALIDTYERFYIKLSAAQYKDQEKILEWLEVYLEFETSLALAGAKIINPNFHANLNTST